MTDPQAPSLAPSRGVHEVSPEPVGVPDHAVGPTGDGPGRTAESPPSPRRRPARRALVVLLVLLLAATGALAVHLYRTTVAWQDRAELYLDTSRDLGEQLAGTRAELSGAQAELEAVRAQLTTAQERIVELAEEKARLGDDREVQRQLADYQERVTDAAGRVALALDQCVQGQNLLIGYLQRADQYDPVELEQYGSDVQALCQAATEANTALQRELAQ
jgi:hypothetical protein